MRQATEWEPGTPVFDKGSLLVGVVAEQQGSKVTLKRPSGLRWETRAVAVRAASDREKLQLKALARHNRNVRGLATIGGRR